MKEMSEQKNERVESELDLAKLLRSGDINEIVIHGENFNEKEIKKLAGKRSEFGITEETEESLKASNPEGREQVKTMGDLDGRAGLFILELAMMEPEERAKFILELMMEPEEREKFRDEMKKTAVEGEEKKPPYNKLTFVKKGASISGSINIDTGERPGFSIEKDGTVFFDHHGDEKDPEGKTTSATKIVYEKMLDYGLLKREVWLDNLVQFVTDIDNESYSTVDGQGENIFKNGKWAKSLYGLAKVIQFETIVKYMKEGRNPAYPFSEKEMEELKLEIIDQKNYKKEKGAKKEVPLADLCKEQQKKVDSSIEGMNLAEKEMKRVGIKSRTKNLGEVLFNSIVEFDQKGKRYFTKDKIDLGFTIVRAFVDSYVKWFGSGFFITSKFDLGKDSEIFKAVSEKFPEAKPIRGTMIVCPSKKEDEASPKIEELLKALEMIN